MEVNNASLSSQIAGQLSQTDRNQQQANAAEQARERENREQSTQRVNRIRIDENAIAILERENSQQNNPSQQLIPRDSLDSNGNGRNGSQPGGRSEGQNASYDRPSARNNSAINTYQAVGGLEQRDRVQQLLGVDVYA
ncbi:MAG: hypothetical protein MK214_11470 [Thalassotalea sp.]|nr:hypothetical protein [Thalassotalea sp.]